MRQAAIRWSWRTVERGYTGEEPAQEAESHGMRLELVNHPGSRQGFALLPRRWVVECRASRGATPFRPLKCRTTSGYLSRWRGRTSSLSLASCCIEPSLHAGRLRNTL
jgi:hypothetical protein